MELQQSVLIGHANNDVHFIQVMSHEDASQIATREAQEIGKLTNGGFRTVVAAIWLREATKTAGISYAAEWCEGEVHILLHRGDRIASSHALYQSCHKLNADTFTAEELLVMCRHAKLGA